MGIDGKTVEKIQEFIEKKRTEQNIINQIIRDDVFSVLEGQCTVLYYSLDDTIEGCHIIKPVNNEMRQFVFINTSKTVQEQVWTAAHELGHVWEVDKFLRKEDENCNYDTELLVSRFAAELLMPQKIFKKEVREKIREYHFQGQRMEVGMMMNMIAYLMNFFCVPYKSIVYRFVELGYVNYDSQNEYFVYQDSEELERAIGENPYTRINQKAESWSIANIQNDLRILEEEELLNKKKIAHIKTIFHLEEESGEEKELNFKG